MKLFAIVICVMLVGCATTQSPTVHTTKQWENHYMTEAEFQRGTAGIALDKGESIWVLSNSTLSRLLKNAAGQADSNK